MSAPRWATRIVEDVWRERGLIVAGLPVPELTWRRSHPKPGLFVDDGRGGFRLARRSRPAAVYTSGRWYPDEHRIVVTAGMDRTDQRLTLLHEIAHALNSAAGGNDHDDAFWRIALRLFQQYRIPMRHALERSIAYRSGAARIAREMGIRGTMAVEARVAPRRRAAASRSRGAIVKAEDMR